MKTVSYFYKGSEDAKDMAAVKDEGLIEAKADNI